SSSAAISSTSSSVSDCVAVFMTPRPISDLMMFCIGTPSACEKSRTLTPDSTETGPVGGAAGWRGVSRRVSSRPRAWRASRGRAAWLSMTTRRRRLPGPPPPRGRSGRFGLPPSVMQLLSVKTPERRIDPHGLPQHPGEGLLPHRPLEARDVRACVRAAPRHGSPEDEVALERAEPDELRLLRPPAAAGTRADGRHLRLLAVCLLALDRDPRGHLGGRRVLRPHRVEIDVALDVGDRRRVRPVG